MIVMFAPDVEKKIIALAAQMKIDPASFVATFVEKNLTDELAMAPITGFDLDADYDPDALSRMIAKMTNRTPEQKREAQQRAIQRSQPKITLPHNVSPFDVMPIVRGNETDEEVLQALKELS